MNDPDQMFTISQAAAFLGIGKTKLHAILGSGALIPARIGGPRLVRISRRRLVAYAQSQEEAA